MSNSVSMLNGLFSGLWDIVTDFFNLIPKVIYFLYATVACGVDAMQAFIRKLAGLDTYFQVKGSETVAVSMKDPLTDFIYGILGFGDNAAAYQGLNTAFWSLAIFGLIILVIATIVAIVKSHYNEDTAGTSPWKYIYTGVKAILSFALIPFVTIIGLGLSSFILKTIDTILAGGGSAEKIVDMYGNDATQIFEEAVMAGVDSEGNPIKSYIRYDMFGSGSASSSQTFGGMLFRAASTNANRIMRDDKMTLSKITQVKSGNYQIFANTSQYSQLSNENEKKIYVAEQVNYAFANNLLLKKSIDYTALKGITGMNVFSGADPFHGEITSFSKFNVGLVWQFYNLWHFSFIVGFAGAFSAFTILISIVMGMMGRLIKGAALFLVYPALLGLAPMDNFKAFKGWGNKFMSLVLTALGSIVGINLLFLVLPYVTTIKFFNLEVVDRIVNIIILVVGLMMAKDFVGMVTELVGTGDNAISTGDGLKGNVSASLKKGITSTAKIGLGTARIGAAAVGTAAKVGKKGMKVVAHGVGKPFAGIRARGGNAKAEELEGTALDARKGANAALEGKQLAMKQAKENNADLEKTYNDARNAYIKQHDSKNLTEEQRKQMEKDADNAAYEAMEKRINERGFARYGTDGKKLQDAFVAFDKADKDAGKAETKALKKQARVKAIADKYGLKVDENGNYKGKGFKASLKDGGKAAGKAVGTPFVNFGKNALGFGKAMAKNFNDALDGTKIGKTMADVFMKSAGDLSQNMGFDKAAKGAADILSKSLRFKGGMFDDKTKQLGGDALANKTAADQAKAAATQEKLLKQIASSLDAQKKTNQATADAISSLGKKLDNRGSNSSSKGDDKK